MFFFLAITSLNAFFVPETCTKDAQTIVDDIFVVIESLERDMTKPDAEAMKGVLDSTQIFLHDCLKIDVDL